MTKVKEKPRCIFLPIENIFREFDWKFLLAAICADENTKVYIGQHDYLYQLCRNLDGGVYIGKNSMRRAADGRWLSERHRELRSKGIQIIHFDEEGAVYHGTKTDWEKKLLTLRADIETLNSKDMMFTWGEFQAETYKQATEVLRSNIVITGHPRFDLLSQYYRDYFDFEVTKIKKTFKNFVLVNGNFSLYNNSLGIADTFSPRMGYDLSSTEARLLHMARWGYVGKTQIEYIQVLSKLSCDYPNQRFVFRPHPSESAEIYRMVFNEVENVDVVIEGSIGEWILASQLVIHDGCTTGLEAYFSETPVINFHPFHDRDSDLFLPNSVGVKCTQYQELLELVGCVLRGESITQYNQKVGSISESLLKNLTEGNDSFLNVVEALEKITITNEYQNRLPYQFQIYRFYYWVVHYFKKILRPLFKTKQKEYEAYRALFPGFNKAKIKNKIKTLEKLTKKKLNLRIYDSNLIKIELNK